MCWCNFEKPYVISIIVGAGKEGEVHSETAHVCPIVFRLMAK